jgi:hypothetical protein
VARSDEDAGSRYEDRQPARSWMRSRWDTDTKFLWEMEVREWVGIASLRMGVLTLQGSVEGALTASLETVWRDQ